MATHQEQRNQLDLLFLFDAVVSVLFGGAALLTPHGLLKFVVGGRLMCAKSLTMNDLDLFISFPSCTLHFHSRFIGYNHDAHEVLR